jgi:hypothetical protein
MDGQVESDLTGARHVRFASIEREERELMSLIDGRRPVRSHGSAAMPIWGVVFEESLIDEPHARRTALLRLQELARYVRKLRASTPDHSERPPPAR